MAILTRRDENAVAYLTMNAPERLNALSDEMLAELQDNLNALKSDTMIRAVVLAGTGKAFCAGHDLKQMTAARQNADGGAAAFKDLFDRCATFMQTVQEIPQPVIAQVHGIATAAGCQLVASCDLAVAAEGTRFGVNGVNIGLFCSTPMVAVSRSISQKNSMEMLLTGDMISADRAEEIGLVNRSTPMKDLEATVTLIAKKIASKSSPTVKIGKKAFYAQKEMDLAQAYKHTSKVMVENLFYEDAKEGISAFLEKRDPDWNDR